MTRSELKQLIRETIQESLVQEGLPLGKGDVGNQITYKLTDILGKFQNPEFEDKAGILAADIIRLFNQDQEWAKNPR